MSSITYRQIKQTEYKKLAEISLRAFGATASPTAVAIERAGFRSYYSVGAFADQFDEETLVGTAMAFDFDLSIPGGYQAPAAGLTLITVDPTHRRQGISRAMLDQLLHSVRDNGDIIASLFASEATIYPRYGFGPATRAVDYTVHLPGALPVIDEMETNTLRFRRVPINSAYPIVNNIYNQRAQSRAGFSSRDIFWWDHRILNPKAHEDKLNELLCVIGYDNNDKAVAYSLYGFVKGADTQKNHLHIIELIGVDIESEIKMHRFMYQHDLVSDITYSNADPTTTWRLALRDQRAVETAQYYDGLWIRILNVQEALTRRSYRLPTEFSLRIHDSRFLENDGLWHIDTSGEQPLVVRLDDDAPIDVELGIADLSEIYLGETSLHQLASVNRITVHNPAMLDTVAMAFSTPERPWAPEDF